MNESGWLAFLKVLSIVCNSLGLLIALVFLFGPKFLISLSKILDTPRRTLAIEKVIESNARLILGFTLVIVTIIMLILALNIRI
ncbi:MAG: hypothetical protein KKH80_00505 [Candidatus Omnitrophica bacterium]|nr:hypothetical protein [Candidatus Omnitrophota bacterium]MBU1871272.1 hypothetical protein [Candidatus Omnitrophota bacterium]